MPISLRFSIALVLSIVCLAVPALAQTEDNRVDWFVVNMKLNEAGNALMIGDDTQVIPLADGWECLVGATLNRLPMYETRTTQCQKGGESFEFTVQCEQSRRKDHVQVRFRGREGKHTDFVEVSCEMITPSLGSPYSP